MLVNLFLTKYLVHLSPAFQLSFSMGTAKLPLIIFFSILTFFKNTWGKNYLTNTHEGSLDITYMQLLPADQGKTNVNIRIMQLIAGKGSCSSQMQIKHCFCLCSYTYLGSPVGDLGDDSTHMPPSSGLPDFWYFINPVKSTLHWFCNGILLSLQGETLCSADRDLSVLLLLH